MEKYFYIYNVKQADFFVKNNLKPMEVGKGNTRAVYIKFLRNEESEEIFNQWCIIQGK